MVHGLEGALKSPGGLVKTDPLALPLEFLVQKVWFRRSNWSLGEAAAAPAQAPQSENRCLGQKLIESRGDMGRSSSLET